MSGVGRCAGNRASPDSTNGPAASNPRESSPLSNSSRHAIFRLHRESTDFGHPNHPLRTDFEAGIGRRPETSPRPLDATGCRRVETRAPGVTAGHSRRPEDSPPQAQRPGRPATNAASPKADPRG